MSGVRAARAEATRRSIVAAAGRLFVEQGYDHTSVDDIIAATGTSKGAVYHRFTDKRDIFEACFRDSQRRIIDGLVARVDPTLEPWDRAVGGIRLFLTSYVADEQARTLLLMASGVLGVDRAHAVDAEISLPFVGAVLDDLAADVAHLDLELTVRILMAGICEAASVVATSAEPADLVERAMTVFTGFVAGLRAVASGIRDV